MIVFDLQCAASHVFEAWFGSSDAYESQRAGGQLLCPICGSGEVTKAVMAPNIAVKGNRRGAAVAAAPPAASDKPTPEMIRAVLAKVAQAQAALLEKSTWVGPHFATRARAMHVGDEAHVPIHGQATREEALDLIDDGVAVAPLLVPVVPPEALN